jgi:hypothetical protein
MIFLTLDTLDALAGDAGEQEDWNLRGSCVCPVTSLRGGIAVVLYGMVVECLNAETFAVVLDSGRSRVLCAGKGLVFMCGLL